MSRPTHGKRRSASRRIDISLQMIGENELELVVKDNGKEYAPVSTQVKGHSLDFSLMEMLTSQLHGARTLRNDDGLSIRLRFPAEFKTVTKDQAC